MEETKKKLYPFEFLHGEYQKPWGKESWTVADMGFEDSEIKSGWLAGNSMSDLMETYLERVVGEDVYQYYGRQFPVLVKFIDIDGHSPLTVHPDDSIAMERYDALGKVKLIYVSDIKEETTLYLGFNRDVSASEFYEKCIDGTICDLLNPVKLEKGKYYLIEPGTVHSVSGKASLICVSESSDVNFILYDPNAGKEDAETQMIHISEAMDFIDFCKYGECHCGEHEDCCDHGECHCGEHESCQCGHDDCKCEEHGEHHHHEDGKIVSTLVERDEFNVTKLNLTDPLHIYTEKFGSFIVYVCAEGEFSVQVPAETPEGVQTMDNYVINKGQAVLIPAEMPDFYLVPRDRDTILLEVVTRPVENLDEYIDPNTEPFLEGEDYGGLEDDQEFDEDGETDEYDDRLKS